MNYSSFDGFFSNFLPDIRLEKRAEKVMTDMHTFGKVVVNKFCTTNTDKIGAYRMFSNLSFDHNNLLEGVYHHCKERQGVNHLLCIQDTTELNFTHHIKRIGKEDKNIGPVSINDMAGFFCHPMLVIDSEQKTPIGFSSIDLWNRSWDKKDKFERDYKNLKISEKESFRWIKSAQETKKVLSETSLLTIIGDRESDIYEELATVPDDRTHLLIRSSINRRLFDSNEKLFEVLDSSRQRSTYNLTVKGNKKRKNRIARMSLKYSKVKILRPKKKGMNDYPMYVEMWAIEARELKESVPQGEDPILWRLLTTHSIEKVEDAMKYLDWYSNRWFIEELFRIMKKKGFGIEDSQLETGSGLKKLVVMALQVALTTMTLKLSIKNKQEIDAGIVFSPEQIQFIKLLMIDLEGETEKQKNPYTKGTLAWSTWGISRLSGWSGYSSHGPPGYITIKSGLDKFYDKFEGYRIALKLLNLKDVYKE
jgi:hypothetical protein